MTARLGPRGRAATLAALALVACSPNFDGFYFSIKNSPPLGHKFTQFEIELPIGHVVVAGVTPQSASNNEYDEDAIVELSSPRPDVIDILPRPEANEFAFVGVSEGEACLDVNIDGAYEGCVPTRVVPVPGE